MEFLKFRKKFIFVLQYIGTPSCLTAIDKINQLPINEENGFHRACLIAQLVSIVSTHIHLEEFNGFPDDAHRIAFTALFCAEVEFRLQESVENSWLYYEKNQKICDENGETVVSILDAFFGGLEDPGAMFTNLFETPEELFEEIDSLKPICDSFVSFALDKTQT